MLLRLGSRGAAEAGAASRWTAYARGSSNKLEKIESDIFIAAGAKTRVIEGFHADKSPKGDATRCIGCVQPSDPCVFIRALMISSMKRTRRPMHWKMMSQSRRA